LLARWLIPEDLIDARVKTTFNSCGAVVAGVLAYSGRFDRCLCEMM